jgi:hypothetical protein
VDEIGGTCSKHGRDDKCPQKILSKILKGRDLSKDLGLYRKIILEWNLGK